MCLLLFILSDPHLEHDQFQNTLVSKTQAGVLFMGSHTYCLQTELNCVSIKHQPHLSTLFGFLILTGDTNHIPIIGMCRFFVHGVSSYKNVYIP